MIRFIFPLFFLFAIRASGQFRGCPGCLPYLAMTGYSHSGQDVFSLAGNPAMPAALKKTAWGVFGESRFIPSGINLFASFISFSTRLGYPGIFLTTLRSPGYRDTEAGFVYSIPLSSAIMLGAGAGSRMVGVAGHRTDLSFHTSLGILFMPLPSCRIGFFTRDPAGLQIADPLGEKSPGACFIGMGYEPSEVFCCSAELVCEEGNGTGFAGLLQYAAGGKFFLRCGFLTSSSTFFSGAGFTYKQLRLSFNVSFRQQLGVNSSMMMDGLFKQVRP